MLIDDFKQSVGKFPTGVTIITTDYNDKLWGFTANSFTSVSLNPALISFCLSKNTNSIKAFNNTELFAINILSGEQASLSQHFANSKIDKFADIDYIIGKHSKAPLLLETISYIECKKYSQYECGDHVIFIGEVVNVFIDHTKSPLLYYAKSYREINEID